MAGGKVHGEGGHGRHSREMRRKYASEIEARQKIERAQEKNLRYVERKLNLTVSVIAEKIRPVTVTAIANLTEAVEKKRVNPTQGIIRMLAIDVWFHEQTCSTAKANGIMDYLNPETLQFLSKNERQKLWQDLIGAHLHGEVKTFGRTPNELREEIAKWKGRVKRIAEGQYC